MGGGGLQAWVGPFFSSLRESKLPPGRGRPRDGLFSWAYISYVPQPRSEPLSLIPPSATELRDDPLWGGEKSPQPKEASLKQMQKTPSHPLPSTHRPPGPAETLPPSIAPALSPLNKSQTLSKPKLIEIQKLFSPSPHPEKRVYKTGGQRALPPSPPPGIVSLRLFRAGDKENPALCPAHCSFPHCLRGPRAEASRRAPHTHRGRST